MTSKNDQELGTELDAYFDKDIGILSLDGVPVGPAGGVDVVLTEGLSVDFDAATAMVSTITVEPSIQAGRAHYRQSQRDMLTLLLPDATQQEAILNLSGDDEHHRVLPDQAMLARLYRLGLLTTVQVFDPVAPASPLWDLEALALAHDGGLLEISRLVARRSIHEAADLLVANHWLLGDERIRSWIPLLSRYGAPFDTEAAEELRRLSEQLLMADLEEAFGDQPADRLLEPSLLDETGFADDRLIVEGTIDLAHVSPTTFVMGLYPTDDVSISVKDSGVLQASVRLHPYARRSTVESHVMRVVDREAREVLASSPLVYRRDSAQATLELTNRSQQFLEITQGSDDPVWRQGLYHLRLGYRYGMGAMRALRGPATLYRNLRSSQLEQEAKNLWLGARDHLVEAGEQELGTLAERYADSHGASLRSEPSFLAEDVVVVGRNHWLDSEDGTD